MIAGIGVDIVDVRRIEKSIKRFGDRFINRILAGEERRELEGRKLASYVAKQFAGKEAVSKALGTGMRVGVHFGCILILRDSYGRPYVELREGAALRQEKLAIGDIKISLSDERDYAIAYVVALG